MHQRVNVPTGRLLGDWSKMNPGWSRFDEKEWTCVPVVKGLTQQPNGYDCGVYTCWYAECVLFEKVRTYANHGRFATDTAMHVSDSI
jgi:hypothetical protein